jgi:hypothetical protein
MARLQFIIFLLLLETQCPGFGMKNRVRMGKVVLVYAVLNTSFGFSESRMKWLHGKGCSLTLSLKLEVVQTIPIYPDRRPTCGD